jgi:predicted nucleotidyltransferase
MRDIEPILTELKARLQDLYGERLKGLYLFGSYARGDASEDSDIDVALVLDDFEYASDIIEETGELVSRLSLACEGVVSIVPIREADLRAREDSFLANVRREGVAVA